MDWISLFLVPAIKSVVLVVILLTGFAYLSYIERKLVARFQVRYGPNRAGPFGMLQPIADALKMVFKEEFVPLHVDRLVYVLAPALAVIPALVIWAVIPVAGETVTIFGQTITFYVADVNVGLLYVLAIASLGTYGVVLAGWSSNNKYSLLGGLRTSAQMLSYELPMGIALVSVVLIVGSLSLVNIVVGNDFDRMGSSGVCGRIPIIIIGRSHVCIQVLIIHIKLYPFHLVIIRCRYSNSICIGNLLPFIGIINRNIRWVIDFRGREKV